MYYYSHTLSLTHSLTNFKVSEAATPARSSPYIYIYIYIYIHEEVRYQLPGADAPYMCRCPIYVPHICPGEEARYQLPGADAPALPVHQVVPKP
jgi:hypothetical protein